jgi:hypothetical protein
MSIINNPYNNVGAYPKQPIQSVENKLLLTETAGLNPYNFVDLGYGLKAFQNLERKQRAAYPIDRTNDFNIDTSNKYYPHLSNLFFRGVASNNPSLNNPPDHNQNLDITSQRTYIKPFYTKNEEPGTIYQ